MQPRPSPSAPEVPGSAGSQAPRRPDSELTEAQLSARAGRCIISISSVAGPGLGEEEQGRKESASGKEAAASASPPCSPLGDVWQLNLGAPGDLGETPLRDLSEAGCTVSAHPRRSGALLRRSRSAGLRRAARQARGPSSQGAGVLWRGRARLSPGRPTRGVSPAGGLGQRDPAAGWGGTRGRLPRGTFPA